MSIKINLKIFNNYYFNLKMVDNLVSDVLGFASDKSIKNLIRDGIFSIKQKKFTTLIK